MSDEALELLDRIKSGYLPSYEELRTLELEVSRTGRTALLRQLASAHEPRKLSWGEYDRPRSCHALGLLHPASAAGRRGYPIRGRSAADEQARAALEAWMLEEQGQMQQHAYRDGGGGGDGGGEGKDHGNGARAFRGCLDSPWDSPWGAGFMRVVGTRRDDDGETVAEQQQEEAALHSWLLLRCLGVSEESENEQRARRGGEREGEEHGEETAASSPGSPPQKVAQSDAGSHLTPPMTAQARRDELLRLRALYESRVDAMCGNSPCQMTRAERQRARSRLTASAHKQRKGAVYA